MTETGGWLCTHDSATLPFWAASKPALQAHVTALPAINHYASFITKVSGVLN